VVDAVPDGLHVVERPGDRSEPRVVVVHGAMDRSSSFGRVARRLEEVPLVLYDRRGYGRSRRLAPGDLPRQVDDLLAVIGDRPAVVFGHSVGGVVALVAAARRPDLVAALLVYEPPTPWVPWWPRSDRPPPPDPADHAEAFMRGAVGDRIWERLGAGIRADRRAEGLALRADLAAMEVASSPFDPSAVRAPTLVAAGETTSWWHRRAAEELADHLPDARFVELPATGHGGHLATPSAVADLVREARSSALDA